MNKLLFLFLLFSAISLFEAYSPRFRRALPPKINSYNEINNLTNTNPDFPYYGQMYSGFVQIDNTTKSLLYYNLYAFNETFIEANAPLLVWLEGGPGCSGMWDSFEAIGPVKVLGNDTDFLFVRNPWTWNKLSHLLIIDQPAGTGFSIANQLNVTNTSQAAYYFNVFMARFYQLFPTLQKQPLYLFGESYGGKWVPGFTYELLQNQTFANQINIAGMGVGNPWSVAITQVRTYGNFGWAAGMVDLKEKNSLYKQEVTVFEEIQNGSFWDANYLTNYLIHELIDYDGGDDIYNYRDFDSDYGEYYLWLNTTEAQNFLGVPDTVYSDCNNTVSDDFYKDEMDSILFAYPYLISKIPVLVYEGQIDPLCNNEGVTNFLNEMDWQDIKKFRYSERTQWLLSDGTPGGLVKSYSNFTYLMIYNAGHLVPWDQPFAAYEMLETFIDGKSYKNSK